MMFHFEDAIVSIERCCTRKIFLSVSESVGFEQGGEVTAATKGAQAQTVVLIA
jgi:hypothetical protein